MPEAIGGYFELELEQRGQFHKRAIALNSGRNCLKYLVKSRGISRVHLPYYICDVVTEALNDIGVEIKYYRLNRGLEPESFIELQSSREYILYANYFGLMTGSVHRLAKAYGCRLIVDNSQAFFCLPIRNIVSFYSPRKFFGVPDGGYLYGENEAKDITEQSISYTRTSHLMKRIDVSAEAGFSELQENERTLKDAPIAKMSRLTARLLSSIDYYRVRSYRRRNFMLLHRSLKKKNNLSLKLGPHDVPMVYPLMLDRKIDMSKFSAERLYTARYWNSVLSLDGIGKIEREMAEKVVFLPIDQRYSKDDMESIIGRVSEL